MDKPAGWTSIDVCARLRRVFGERRIGHGGTLDPMATGVLPVFVGRATRAAAFSENAEKQYTAVLRLGLTTNTQDLTGEILTQLPPEAIQVAPEQLEAVLKQFTGPQEQIPPMYSAVKVNGRRLYALAREGREVERQPRHIVISELELLEQDSPEYKIRVRCSKGTYIRTLCADIGAALGCGACMTSLRRTAAGCFTLAQAVSMDELLALSPEEAAARLLPVDTLFASYPAVYLNSRNAGRCRNGAPVYVRDTAPGEYRVYAESSPGAEPEFLCLARCDGRTLQTVKSFFEV